MPGSCTARRAAFPPSTKEGPRGTETPKPIVDLENNRTHDHCVTAGSALVFLGMEVLWVRYSRWRTSQRIVASFPSRLPPTTRIFAMISNDGS